MKKALKFVAMLVVGVVVLAAGFYLWAASTASRVLARTYQVHSVDFPIPFPLTDEEREASRLTGEAGPQLAQERALERGKHLVEARYGCVECHGQNFGGGVMVDAPIIGRILGPNITTGEGSRTIGYGPADWDHIVRHGILPDGRPAAMPSEDFQQMTDQELSDIVVYLRSFPPVNHEVPRPTLGPLGKLLLAMGKMPLSADVIQSHDTPHLSRPPAAEVSVAFGRHLSGVCTGCHGQDLSGGPIVGGDPSWAPARNITPDATGLGSWSYEQFVAALREGRRPDSTGLRMPMSMMVPYAQRMTDVELEALWMYLRSVPAVPTKD